MIILSGDMEFNVYKPFSQVLSITVDEISFVFNNTPEKAKENNKLWEHKYQYIPSQKMLEATVDQIVRQQWISTDRICPSGKVICQLVQSPRSEWNLIPAKSICCTNNGFRSGVVKIGDCVWINDGTNEDIILKITHVFSVITNDIEQILIFHAQIATLENVDNTFTVDLVWGKHYKMCQEMPDLEGEEQLFGGWYFVQQNWNENEEWPVIPVGIDMTNVKFPVLIRHVHVGIDDKLGLDWTLLNNLWAKQNFQDIRAVSRQSDKICRLSNYCKCHQKWIFNSAQEFCDEGSEIDRCSLNTFLHCHMGNNRISWLIF